MQTLFSFFLVPLRDSIYASSMVFQTLLLVGTMDGHNQEFLTSLMSWSIREWFPSYFPSLCDTCLKEEWEVTLLNLPTFTTARLILLPLRSHGLISHAVKGSFTACLKAFHNFRNLSLEYIPIILDLYTWPFEKTPSICWIADFSSFSVKGHPG